MVGDNQFVVQLILYKSRRVSMHTFLYVYFCEIISRYRCIFLHA